MSDGHQYDRMIPVSSQHPCPVCGKPDWCLIAPDGSAAICPRTESEKLCGDAGWLHKLRTYIPSSKPATGRKPYAPKPKSPPRDWSANLARWQNSREPELDEFAKQLGVSRDSLARLGTGYDRFSNCWMFPERDCSGTVIGICSRDRNGEKRTLANSRRGLCFPVDWEQTSGPILLVEGATDTAATLSMGLCGIGRPSNTGGVDHLIGLLEGIPLDREILVVGEWDQKADGSWPGRSGADSTARQLAQALERPIAWVLPPDGAKDTRSWLQAAPRYLPVDRLGDLFVSGMNVNWIPPTPLYSTPTPAGPPISLDYWRQAMLAVRIENLTTPGCYLDASPTGSGKSFVDIKTLVHASLREVA